MTEAIAGLQVGEDEVVDVVDADDRIVGRATRAIVRAENLWHRACFVVPLDGDGRIFVHLRTATKDVFPSYYDVTVGGVVGAGESYQDAAEREVREEIGVEPRNLEKVGRLHYEDAANRVIGEIFDCRVIPPLTLQPEEVVSGEWLEVPEAARRIAAHPFCPDGVVAFGEWRRRRGI